MTDRTPMAPGSAIITAANYAKQLSLVGKYQRNGKRCWYPSASIHRKMQKFILNRDGQQCVECGSRNFLHLDHVTPYQRGGLYIEWNLQALCESCNARKGARDAVGQHG